jgi:Na+/pantothenate symporter
MLFLGLDKLFWFWSFFETGLIVFIFWNRIDFLVWTNCFAFGHFMWSFFEIGLIQTGII